MTLSRRTLGGAALGFLCCRTAIAREASFSCDPLFDGTDLTALVDRATVSRFAGGTDNDYENSLIWVLVSLADYLGINFAFGFYTERTIPNAAYVDDNLDGLAPIKQNMPSDGTILFGRKLVKETQRVAHNFGAAMTALAAHEAGHALQKKYSLRPVFMHASFGSVRAELCADFVCGYCAAYRETIQSDYPSSIQAITQFRKGDKKFIPSGHGTSKERARAVDAGYLYGRNHPSDGKAAVLKAVEYTLALKL
jgi:hypothetical protein